MYCGFWMGIKVLFVTALVRFLLFSISLLISIVKSLQNIESDLLPYFQVSALSITLVYACMYIQYLGMYERM